MSDANIDRPVPPIQLVYPYEPLEENLLDQPGSVHVELHRQQVEAYDAWHKQQKKKQKEKAKNNGPIVAIGDENTVGDDTDVVPKPITIGCTTSGLWGLRYKEPATQREFNRFCHRSSETIPWMFLFVFWSFSELGNNPEPSLRDSLLAEMLMIGPCMVFTIVLHCWKRGHRATATVALLRIAANFICNIAAGTSFAENLGRQCKPDPLYPALHGGEDPSIFDTYRGCLNTIPTGAFIVPLIGFHILRVDIYALFFLNFFAFMMYVLNFAGVWYRPSPTQGFAWELSWQLVFTHVVIAFTVATASNLCGIAINMSLQRGFEAAMAAAYELRSSRRRIKSLDQLMQTLVPASALERLIANKEVLDRRPHATVLFSDMVSFTAWSSSRTAKQVVSMLSVLVKRIDMLAASDDGVTKVKTIGDCYWAASGIPVANDNHAAIMIRFACKMMDIVREEALKNKEWDYLPVAPKRQAFSTSTEPEKNENGNNCQQETKGNINDCSESEEKKRRPVMVRTGLHTGPLSGGILGSQQISYEVFGQTSSLANKVEAEGVKDRVAVSETTRHFAEGCGARFKFEKHKPIAIFEPQEGDASPTGKDDQLANSTNRNELQLFLIIENSLQADEAEHVNGLEVVHEDVAVVATDPAEEDAVRADRMKFIKNRVLDAYSDSTGSVVSETGTNMLQNATEEASEAELLERFSASTKVCCCGKVFEDPVQQDEFERFSIMYNLPFRVKGIAAVTAVFGVWTILTLFTAGPKELSAGAVIPMVLGLCILVLSVILAERRRIEVERAVELEEVTGGVVKAHDVTRPKPVDFYGVFLSLVGANVWLICAFFVENSLLTNDIYFGLVLQGLILISSNHFPVPRSGFIALLGVIPIQIIFVHLRRHTVQDVAIFILIASAITPVLMTGYQLPIRLRFIQDKVAKSLVAQQKAVSGIQEEILKTMLPDFVISPLMLWIESEFSVTKAVVRDHKYISVAFMRLSPTARPKPKALRNLQRQQSSPVLNRSTTSNPTDDVKELSGSFSSPTKNDSFNNSMSASVFSAPDSPLIPLEMAFLFDGHRVIDEILKKNSVVDKVKTVGDLVIVAGSFRGHNPSESAQAMLKIGCQVRDCFEPNSCTTGLHIGPVMGVVLGYTRLAFDIFGDTVNTTSRIMTNPDNKHKVTASAEFIDQLDWLDETAKQPCTFGKRREILAKGKGSIAVHEVLPLEEEQTVFVSSEN